VWRQLSELAAAKTDLYTLAEGHTLQRYSQRWSDGDSADAKERRRNRDDLGKGGDAGNKARLFWRATWYKDKEEEITRFYKHCHVGATEDAPVYVLTDDIYEYLTGTVAKNKHDKWIEGVWVWRLGLCDVAGFDPDIEYAAWLGGVAGDSYRAQLPGIDALAH
jgi:hypothetical protein